VVFANKLMKAYFNFVYNPVYDFTTARFNRYRELQESCIEKLTVKDKDLILCVGVGTGNEVVRILQANRNTQIVGIDYSETALRKAYEKALRLGIEIEVAVMDAQRLEFLGGTFDKVMCFHVMDFVEDKNAVTHEILRVLRKGGRFVITYPSRREGPKLGCNLLRDNIRNNIATEKHRILSVSRTLVQMLAGIIYVPLLFRPNQKSCSRTELEAIFTKSTTEGFQIEEDPLYQDLIVYGRK
jgi:ubiquinone/menaquinone biosynthesis C-methylase UbiE